MKTTKRVLIPMILGCLFLGVVSSEAAILRVAPTESAVLPQDESGLTKVALQFDISAMRQGAGRRITEAFLEWSVNGVSSSSRSEFAVHEITGTWDEAGAKSGQTAITSVEDPADDWDIEPLDYQRAGGLVRLDLMSLVGKWIQSGSNFGVLMTTPDLTGETLKTQLANARLVIRYGFFSE